MYNNGYYYLHVNGNIIFKPFIVVNDDIKYFDSNFVIKWWKVNTEIEYNNMIVEAKNLMERI